MEESVVEEPKRKSFPADKDGYDVWYNRKFVASYISASMIGVCGSPMQILDGNCKPLGIPKGSLEAKYNKGGGLLIRRLFHGLGSLSMYDDYLNDNDMNKLCFPHINYETFKYWNVC